VNWSIGVLGGWQLFGPDGEVRQVRHSIQRLLAFLVMHGRIQQRALVAGTLWPDSCDRRASANLRSTIWHARNESPGIADADWSTVWLCADVAVDFDQATDVIRAALLGHPVSTGELATLRDDLLPDWEDDWVVANRFLHRQLRLLALETVTGDAPVTTVSSVCSRAPGREDR
jgi:DNA-binding SARP family transcriptional activator